MVRKEATLDFEIKSTIHTTLFIVAGIHFMMVEGWVECTNLRQKRDISVNKGFDYNLVA